MEIDMIVVLVLALMFFGGVLYLVLKERGRAKSQPEDIPAMVQNSREPIRKAKTR